jgi:membrane associated rhomboid family serine protease
MALADRYYMREAFNTPRMTKCLIWFIIRAFVLQSLLWFYWDINVNEHLGLTTRGVFQGKVWQLITFQFLHSCPFPLHVLFNCLGLWFFGRPVEEALGSRRFLTLYFASGLVGGLLQVLLPLVLPRHEDVSVVGASAGVCGMIAIFCSLYPMQELTTWIYFFPVQIRARYLLIFLTAISVFGTLVPLGGVAHGAHLGGILVGIVYVRWGAKFSDWLDRVRGRRKVGLRLRLEPRKQRSRSLWGRKAKAIGSGRHETFISREVDPILDKISAHGFESLTEDEKKVLEAARKKIAGR